MVTIWTAASRPIWLLAKAWHSPSKIIAIQISTPRIHHMHQAVDGLKKLSETSWLFQQGPLYTELTKGTNFEATLYEDGRHFDWKHKHWTLYAGQLEKGSAAHGISIAVYYNGSIALRANKITSLGARTHYLQSLPIRLDELEHAVKPLEGVRKWQERRASRGITSSQQRMAGKCLMATRKATAPTTKKLQDAKPQSWNPRNTRAPIPRSYS